MNMNSMRKKVAIIGSGLGGLSCGYILQRNGFVAHSLKSMQADFVQTKTMKMLGDKMVSNGKMYYQQSDKLHWEYTM